MRRLRLLWAPVLLLAACSGSSSPDDAVSPIADPTSSPLDPGAPFEPGARVDLGSADGAIGVELNSFAEDVVFPGDLDGDGIDDVVLAGWIGAPPEVVECRDGCPGFARAFVDVVYGGPALALRADARLVGWYVHDLRYRVSPAGDVDGDGRADLLVGIGTEGCEQGSAILVYGGARLAGEIDVRDAGVLFREEGTCGRFGEVSALGDLDGDGLDDFAVGALGTDGPEARVLVYYGRTERFAGRVSDADADAVLVGPGVPELARADRAGDVDGDGRGDAIVHLRIHPGAAREGAAFLLRSRAERFSGVVSLAESAIAIEGSPVSVAALGDLDADGRDDFALATGRRERDVLVFLGREAWPSSIGPDDADAWIARADDSNEPTTVAGAGDVDGDGRLDLLYGDPAYGDLGVPRGAVQFVGGDRTWSGEIDRSSVTVFVGQDWFSSTEPDIRRGFDRAGAALAGGGDVNADGLDDFALAAPLAPDGGRVYLWLGRSGS